MSLISSCFSLYDNAEKKKRLWFLFFFPPFPWTLALFLVESNKYIMPKVIPKGHFSWPILVLSAFSFELAIGLVAVGLLVPFFAAWLEMAARRAKSINSYNAIALVGIAWVMVSWLIFGRVVAKYCVSLLFG